MAETNVITSSTADIDITVRIVDFETQFARRMDFLLDLLGVTRKSKRNLGETLRSFIVTGELEDGNVAEGEVIPFSKLTVKEKGQGEIEIEKHARAATLEAIIKNGKEAAITKVDEELMNLLLVRIMNKLLAQLQKGTLVNDTPEANFQMAVAMAVGNVKDQFEKMNRGVGRITAFANTLDVARYLGSAGISSQTQYGMEYLKDFLGVERLIVHANIPAGKVIATPADNIVLNYVDPANGDLASLGADYSTSKDSTNLIGVTAHWNKERMQSELYTWSAMALWAEYLNGIAQISFGAA